MIQVEDREAIRRACLVEHKSIRAIAQELHHGRDAIWQALASAAAAVLQQRGGLNSAGLISPTP